MAPQRDEKEEKEEGREGGEKERNKKIEDIKCKLSQAASQRAKDRSSHLHYMSGLK